MKMFVIARNNRKMRLLGIFAMVATLLVSVSCKEDNPDEEDNPSAEITESYNSLKVLVDECALAHLDAASFTAESYALYAEAYEKAMKAVRAGIKADGAYADLLAGLQAARRGLTLTEWIPITSYLPQCAMLVITNEDAMPQAVDAADKLGVFSGSKCLGIAYPEMQPDGKYYFFLQILQDYADEYNTDIRIVLKYHSALTNLVYTSSEMTYEDQCILGSIDEPYRPLWQ